MSGACQGSWSYSIGRWLWSFQALGEPNLFRPDKARGRDAGLGVDMAFEPDSVWYVGGLFYFNLKPKRVTLAFQVVARRFYAFRLLK